MSRQRKGPFRYSRKFKKRFRLRLERSVFDACAPFIGQAAPFKDLFLVEMNRRIQNAILAAFGVMPPLLTDVFACIGPLEARGEEVEG